MNNWESTLQQFRALGGVAENVELSEGAYGRGLFVKDPMQPVKISVPKNLLVSVEWLQFDTQGNLTLSDACDWDNRTKEFYLNYHRDYGIAGSLMQDIVQQQSQLFDLPESLKVMLTSYGVNRDLFQKPSLQASLATYKKSRRISLDDDKFVLMPLLELVNHDELSKKSFNKTPDLGVSGRFKNEILVNYGMSGDAALMFEGYGFSTPKPYTFSGALAINVGSMVIKIARFVSLYTTIGKTNVPKLKLDGNEIHLSCLVLGSVNDKSSPKKIFTRLMNGIGMPAHIADSVFDGIVEQNRSFFLHLLEELKPLKGSAVEGLRVMAKNQLLPLGVRINT
jgi:hypothetical protein